MNSALPLGSPGQNPVCPRRHRPALSFSKMYRREDATGVAALRHVTKGAWSATC